MLNILLLEDEKYTRMFFKKLLYEIPEVLLVIDTSNGKEAIQLARQNDFNLILLDIELMDDDINGLQVAKQIYEFNKEAYYVFVTAYAKYAVSSFAVHPYSYVLKPIVIDDFKALIKEIADRVNRNERQNNNLIIQSADGKEFINMDDIIFIEIENKKSIIHSKHQKWYIYKSLDQINTQLNDSFLRVHRSYIVNKKQIKKIKAVWDRSYEIEFWDYPMKAQMSRYQYKKHKEMLKS